MTDQTPAEMRETAKRLREAVRHLPHEGHAADTLAGADALDRLAAILIRDEEVAEDEGWHIGGAWGDYGEVVVPLRILSYVIGGELDQQVVSTDPGYALTYAEQTRRAEQAESRLADVIGLADDVIEYRAGRIGTHYGDCYRHHAGCLAARIRATARGETSERDDARGDTHG